MKKDDITNLKEVEKVLLGSDEIKEKIAELGKQITEDYKDSKEPLVLVGILKGSVFFLTVCPCQVMAKVLPQQEMLDCLRIWIKT